MSVHTNTNAPYVDNSVTLSVSTQYVHNNATVIASTHDAYNNATPSVSAQYFTPPTPGMFTATQH